MDANFPVQKPVALLFFPSSSPSKNKTVARGHQSNGTKPTPRVSETTRPGTELFTPLIQLLALSTGREEGRLEKRACLFWRAARRRRKKESIGRRAKLFFRVFFCFPALALSAFLSFFPHSRHLASFPSPAPARRKRPNLDGHVPRPGPRVREVGGSRVSSGCGDEAAAGGEGRGRLAGLWSACIGGRWSHSQSEGARRACRAGGRPRAAGMWGPGLPESGRTHKQAREREAGPRFQGLSRERPARRGTCVGPAGGPVSEDAGGAPLPLRVGPGGIDCD